jgi:integrase
MNAKSPDAFVEFARNNPVHTENKIIAFLSSERARADRGEISAGTINNWVKAARLFLDMSDVQLNWKKIRRVLPRARRYALDRVPTIDELREILDAADLRGKALTLIFASSGIREGAIPYLQISDYSHVKKDGHLVAGRLQVYSGDPERYVTFITPEDALLLISTLTSDANMERNFHQLPHYSGRSLILLRVYTKKSTRTTIAASSVVELTAR